MDRFEQRFTVQVLQMNGWVPEDIVEIVKDPGRLERVAVYQKHEGRQEKKRPQEMVLCNLGIEFQHVSNVSLSWELPPYFTIVCFETKRTEGL